MSASLIQRPGSLPKIAYFKVSSKLYKGSMTKLQLAQLYFYPVNQNTVQHNTEILKSLKKIVADGLPRLEATMAFTAISGFHPMQVQNFLKANIYWALSWHFIHNVSFMENLSKHNSVRSYLLFTLTQMMEVAKGMTQHLSTKVYLDRI